MTNDELADTLIYRLNALVKDVGIRADVLKIIEARVEVSKATIKHPSIQVEGTEMGFLGLLNGLLGTIPTGKYKGCPYIAAVFDDADKLVRFRRTDKPE